MFKNIGLFFLGIFASPFFVFGYFFEAISKDAIWLGKIICEDTIYLGKKAACKFRKLTKKNVN